jgi:type IV pilus assembly protein PilC
MTDQEEESYARVRVPARHVALFTRQLSSMLLAGVPLLQALDALTSHEDCPAFGNVVSTLADLIASGHNFSSACAKFPRVFPPVYTSMLTIGERVGQLDSALDRLAIWLEKDDALRRRILSALSYPGLILSVACLLTLALFYTVLPGFLQIFRDMNIPMPFITRLVMAVTDAVRNPGAWLLAVALAGLSFSSIQAIMARRAWRLRAYRYILWIPVLGRMLRAGSLARFSSAAATMMNSGLEVTRSFQLAAGTSASPLLETDSSKLVKSIREGELISCHMLERPEIYPPALAHMVAAGEEASCMPEMLQRAADYQEQECNYLVDGLSAAIEPVLLGCVAVVIATVVLSVFLPMYSYIGNLGG